LEWGLPQTAKQIDAIGPYDLVIAADCMYVDQVRGWFPDVKCVCSSCEHGGMLESSY
jgi:hypothetical protein